MAKILIIDDDVLLCEMMEQMVTLTGHEATCATNGKIGQQLLETGSFDLIITDIIMPEQEGLETIRAIRSTTKKIPLIAISGGGAMHPDDYLMLAQKMGADYTFTKPLDSKRFLAAIRECLGG